MLLDVGDLREDYTLSTLEMKTVDPNPFIQFQTWFNQVQEMKLVEPNAMVLSTASAQGRPSARTVLLKGMDEDGFIFYSNYESRKGQHLAENPYASLTFLWLPLHRQVRIEGEVLKLEKAQSEKYFQSRPIGSQIGAWASPQSQPIPSRSILEDKVVELGKKYLGKDKLPCPDFWGGYKVKPTLIEFWQGRSNRLHDRIQYKRDQNGIWEINRLAP